MSDPTRDAPRARPVDVVVIGAGQAGLSAAYHLRRRGFVAPAEAAPGARTYVVLDGEAGPGGAWRHRWRSLRMATVNGIHDLPGMALPDPPACEPANEAIPDYFARYERELDLAVVRPVMVRAVRRSPADAALLHDHEEGLGGPDEVGGGAHAAEERDGDGVGAGGEGGRLLVETDAGAWGARAVINATGTWRKPFWPRYPGQLDFRGTQLHVADYERAEDFAGRHTVVVGGGISAVQLLDEISRVTSTTWVTRREPLWREDDFDREAGRRAVALVEERVRAGLPPRSVVSVTGLLWTPALRAARERGALERHPMFTRIEPDGVRMADGSFQPAQAILWATGFRAQLDHLAPLGLRGHGGGIAVDGTRVRAEPRVHLVGYGPSSSTVGANRAGRDAVREITALLDA
ncbi:NAD(P)-binding domain-containing protein [Georgenia sp. MJ206]|uniref:NAD(P)-binding domain-containing protein n=1 Tax=Georgenia wangjunii TaxID=3117730 RepID=UPI002F2610F9